MTGTAVQAGHSTTVSLSSQLRAACSAPKEWRADEERGAYPVEGEWRLPERITERLKAEARAALARAELAFEPAPRETVKQWLISLGTLCAGQMTAADAKAKIGAYAPMLQHPALCFTRETLEGAGRKFTWFPAFGEVAAFLDDAAAPTKALAYRLRRIADAQVSPAPPPPRYWKDLTPEEQAEHERLMDNWRRAGGTQPNTVLGSG